jgi:hypothetical protein
MEIKALEMPPDQRRGQLIETPRTIMRREVLALAKVFEPLMGTLLGLGERGLCLAQCHRRASGVFGRELHWFDVYLMVRVAGLDL